MELALTIISINLCYIGYVLNEILKTSNMKQKFEHPKVLSENGNELFFDEQGYLIREEPKQETLLGKTISKKDADKDSFEDVTNYKIERSYSEEEVLEFTQTMIMQYKFGNTNIEQMDLLKETLQLFKNK
jgi:hypothetical protein